MEMMLRHESNLGGESSGHIICRDRITTGDGIISALQVMEAMHSTKKTLLDLKQGMTKYPQCLVNVRISQKVDLDAIEPVQRVKAEIEQAMRGCGRVLLRPSGTEPLVRIMVEGEDIEKVRGFADYLANTLSEILGA